MRLLPDSARGQRSLAVVLLLIFLLLIYLLFVHWWFVGPYLTIADQYNDLRDEQYRFAELIHTKPEVEKQLRQVAAFEQGNQSFLSDADATSAFSDLSERLKRAVDHNLDPTSRCQITGVSPSPNRDGEVYLRVSASVVMTCSSEVFAKVLYDLENSNPYLFVDRLVLYRQQPMQTQPGKPASGATLLGVQFTLSGYLRQSGKAKAAGK